MSMPIQEPFTNKEIDGKKMKKKKSNLEMNGSLKEENELDVTHDKKKKKQKKNKIVTESIDGDENLPEEKPKICVSEETMDTKDKKKKKKNNSELNTSLEEENNPHTTEPENGVDVTDHKKKKQKKDKLVTESIDGDKNKLDIESVLPEELKTSLSEEKMDTKEKKEKKKKKSELNVSLKEEKDVKTTEGKTDVDVTDHKKKKHKKDKLVTESINDGEKKSDVKSGLPEENTKTSPSDETMDTKDKKKKKKKSELNVSLEEENDLQTTEAENDVDVTNHKKKKQKKNKFVTESIDGDEKKSDIDSAFPVEKPKTSPSEEMTTTKDKKKKTKKEAKEMKSVEPLDLGADNNQITKKRKRSDEIEVEPAEETTVKDSKRRKSDGLEVNSMQIVANGETTGNDPLKLLKNGPEKSGQKQQRNDSAEPKTVHAFQRVKIDEVEFVDDRLQDNSYWAKSGAEKGYGAKAQEILGQVKGRDFRHEKTKKKRGSYRGGMIDLDSHSIKFNYSDEE